VLCIDSYYNVRNRGKSLENHIPELVDSDLILPENQWIRRTDPDRFQAVIPLPYFHIGSENIWLDGGCDIINKSFITIRNSGLPSMGSLLSRTSINQTVENVSAIVGPSCDNLNLSRYPSRKPFLLMVARCDLKYWHENELVKSARWIDSSGVFDFYELPFNSFRNIQDSLSARIFREFDYLPLYKHQNISSSDSILNFSFINFDSLSNDTSFYGSGCFSGKGRNKNLLYSGPIPAADTGQSYCISFWIDNIRKDLYPRTTVTITETDLPGNVVKSINYTVSKELALVSGNRAMVEYRFRVTDTSNKLNIYVQNRILKNKLLKIDNVLLRPQTTDVYYHAGNHLWKNNYYYCK